ncbi:MAG TPA: hypothetical protein VMF61_00225, partial [Candidatus Acidoferrales bacterium]|nr:hypothetical protein [Candidatus Acidoferrales bacterium]
VEAWYAALKFGLTAEVNGSKLHFTKLCHNTPKRQKALHSEELGVGAALLTAERVLDMQYFADFEWFMAGKPVTPASAFARFKAKTVTGSSAPDFIILDRSGAARLLEAKGTFEKSSNGELKKGKKQIANIALSGPTVSVGQVAATKLPDNQTTQQRPLTVLLDPKPGKVTIGIEDDDIKRFFFSKILAFCGFDEAALQLLRHEPVQWLADWLRVALQYAKIGSIPLCWIGGDAADQWFILISDDKARELLNFAQSERRLPPEVQYQFVAVATEESLEDLSSLGIGISSRVMITTINREGA